MKETVNIFGYEFIRDATYNELVDDITRGVATGTMGITNLITPNAHGLNAYARFPELERFCKSSVYILPDGMPIVWLSRFTSRPIRKRLTGSDLFPVLFNRLIPPANRCLFILSKEKLAPMFREKKPDAFCLVPPYFEMSDAALIDEFARRMAQIIVANNINYVFIGISEPKQGALAQRATAHLREAGYAHPCIFFFLGASYEFYMGLKKRAPRWLQNTGLEWLFRLMAEPGRMYKRYIFGNMLFLLRAFKWLISKRQKS